MKSKQPSHTVNDTGARPAKWRHQKRRADPGSREGRDVLKSGCRWVDCPPEYGPAKTVYNRFNRWSAQGIWQSIFEAAAEPAEPPERMALDSTHVKAHRCAGGGKGGRRNRRLASPRAGATARFTALSISCAARES